MPLLLLRNLFILMNKPSLLKVYLFERKISCNIEEIAKSPCFIKLNEEVETEMKKLEKINKEWEEKVIKSLQKKSIKANFIQNFLDHLKKGSFQNLEFLEASLNEAVNHFLEYYKRDLSIANNDCLLTFKLLQISQKFTEIFKWNFSNNAENIDFNAYLEKLKNMDRETLVKSVAEN